MRDLIRKLFVRVRRVTPVDLTGRAFIVTGTAENSLGFATAKTLLEWGGEVTVTRRSGSEKIAEELKEQLPDSVRGNIFAHDLDLASAESVKAFSSWYRGNRPRLDVLVNNAGIHLDLLSQWKEPRLTKDNVETHWRTNYLGTSHLTHELLPLLCNSASETGNARVVNVVSMLHDRGSNSEFFSPVKPYNSWEAYGQSKLGLVHFTHELDRRFAAKGLKSYCLHPGSVYTNVATKGLAGNPLIEGVRNALAPIERFFLKTPEEGAQTQILCAVSPGARSGEYYRSCKPAKLSTDGRDLHTAQKLWDVTADWVAAL